MEVTKLLILLSLTLALANGHYQNHHTSQPENHTTREHHRTSTHRPWATHRPTRPVKQPLYCYSCNENQAACSVPTLDIDRLNTEHYVPCNGQCMQYQNQWDNHSKEFFFIIFIFINFWLLLKSVKDMSEISFGIY